MTRFMMHSKLAAIGADLVAEKMGIDRGEGRGSGPNHSPKKVGLAKSRLLEMLVWREAVVYYDGIMGDMEYRERKGGSTKARKGLIFTLRAQTQIRHSGQILFVPPYLLIGPVLFQLHTKDLAYSK